MKRMALLIPVALVLMGCAHGGGEILPSPERDLSQVDTHAPRPQIAAAAATPIPPDLKATGEGVIEPNPTQLDIRSVPTHHHAVDFVSARSAVITASPSGSPVTVHNNGELLGRDGCAEVELSPEGDTRLTIILPESGREIRSRFYLVGCAPGPAVLTIISEGELLNVYRFDVAAP